MSLFDKEITFFSREKVFLLSLFFIWASPNEKERKNYPKKLHLLMEVKKNIIAKSWMLAHGIASLVAVGMFVYDEEKILDILK